MLRFNECRVAIFLVALCLIFIALPSSKAKAALPDMMIYLVDNLTFPPDTILDTAYESERKGQNETKDSGIPVPCDTLRIHWLAPLPDSCKNEYWHIMTVCPVNVELIKDNGDGYFSPCDYIKVHFKGPFYCKRTWYHVKKVGEWGGKKVLLLERQKLPYPTMSQWGIISLAALLVLSGIWLWRRKRIRVPV